VRVCGRNGCGEPPVEDSSSLLCALRVTPLRWDLGGPGISPTETKQILQSFRECVIRKLQHINMRHVHLESVGGCSWMKVLLQLEINQQAFGQEFHWCTSYHISSTNDSLGCCIDHCTTVQTGCCLTWMSNLWGLSLLVQRHDSHMVINPGCIYWLIGWSISISVWAFMALMNLDLINGPLVLHNLIPAQGSPVPC